MQIDKNALPSTKQESWKYTNLATIYSKNNIAEILLESQQTKDYLQGFQLDAEENVIIILDGVLAIDYNQRLDYISKAEFSADNRDMSVLAKDNAKSFSITIPKDTKDNLTLICVNTPNAKHKLTNIALKLNVEEFATLDLDVDFVNLTDETALNVFLDVDIAASAKVNFTNNADNPNNTKLLTTANYAVNLAKAAEFNGFNLLNKDSLLRNDFIVNLNGESSRFDMRGLYLLNEQAIANACFLINHKASNTYSNVDFKGVVNGSAKAWFNAKAVVNKDVKQIQAYQNNKNIQLSKKAEINTKPELEIYSDDVVCTHGATIGELDKEALFYLQSRGLTLEGAQYLLLEGFVKAQLTADDFPFNNEVTEGIVEDLDDILDSIFI